MVKSIFNFLKFSNTGFVDHGSFEIQWSSRLLTIVFAFHCSIHSNEITKASQITEVTGTGMTDLGYMTVKSVF